MKLIDRTDIEKWAERFDSKGNFPTLVSKLVRATTPASTQIDFPSGSAAFVGGWDGVVDCQEDKGVVPIGISLWEFGTEANPKGKADKDYKKRTADPLGYDISKSTFIFITPRFWKFKDKWRLAKLKEGKWMDIRVYDSSSIEQWLDTTDAVSRWFSSYVIRYPFDGIQTPEEFWEEWSIGPKNMIFHPEAITAGREVEQKLILDFLQSSPGIKGVKASTKSEAIAFIIACAKQFEVNENERFFSKTLIVDTEGNYRGIRINTTTPLNLIPRFEETQPLYAAVSKGHHVLVPLGADDSFNQETIQLPTNDRDGQVNGIIKMGFGREEAQKFSRESGRNVTILKKLLGFPQNKAKWIKTENIREIIPVLLIGRWNETHKGDKEILEKLSGLKYEQFSTILNKWRDFEESPLIQIGETWRLTSPLDAWTNFSPFLSKNDIEMLRECFMFAFEKGNPIVEQNNDNSKFSMFANKEKTFSGWAREGLVQSLILIGLYGEGLKIPSIATPQLWVDSIIHSLLFNAAEKLWVSLNYEMPLISEASPSSFFAGVFESLLKDTMPIMAMFIEEEGALSPTSNHTGLLWALEGLAWIPEYIYNSSQLLLKFTTLDPGGKLSNRPLNSLTEIFKPWHYQTLADYDQRMEVLKKITNDEKDYGWQFLIRLLPADHGVAHPTHKMRWRMFEINSNIKYTYQEIWNTHSFIVDLLIKIFDYSEIKFAQLIEESENVTLGFNDRKKILDFAETEYLNVDHKEYSTWHILRTILARHRSHPNAKWALPETELKPYDTLYSKLVPEDTIQKYLWLFNNHWPEFPEGNVYDEKVFEKKQDAQQKKIDDSRIMGLNKIIQQFGIDKVKELSTMVKEPWALGDTLAKVVEDDKDIFSIVELLNNEKENLRFIHSFIYRKTIINSIKWAFSLFEKLQTKGFNNKALAQIFVPLYQSKELWDFVAATNVEIQKEYWLNVQPHFYHISKEDKIIGIDYLIKYKRFFTAIDICSHFPDEIPSEIIVTLLRKSATEEASENIRYRGYEIGRLFETLDKRKDIDHSNLIQLEWLFLPILDSYNANRSPKLLHEELATNPIFFVDILKWVFIPKDSELLEKERNGITDEIIQNRARQGYQLLHSWKRIPGMKEDGKIDESILKGWVEAVRKLAEEVGRLEVADMQIGQILAQYPEKDLNWPPDEISNIIEKINTKSIRNNFSTALFNKRGSSTRGVFDGGDIERGHAKYFKQLAEKHKIKFPVISEIFSHLAKGYLADAKKQDESAQRDRLEY